MTRVEDIDWGTHTPRAVSGPLGEEQSAISAVSFLRFRSW